ncbi:hypothetical protein F8M41_004900 [Gigaspora margarita]|uniref:Uncharacterized protein n=1 Tax=Gigaspora margarita TaxID=4874 RepID=A0A8H3X9P7_GIGMA|nr:hypothetical protein F8M41_004900 [Gigaspora margarita]
MLYEAQNTNVLLNGGNTKEYQSSAERTARVESTRNLASNSTTDASLMALLTSIPFLYDGNISEEQSPLSQLPYQPFIEQATRVESVQDIFINNISLMVSNVDLPFNDDLNDLNGNNIDEEPKSFLQSPHQSFSEPVQIQPAYDVTESNNLPNIFINDIEELRSLLQLSHQSSDEHIQQDQDMMEPNNLFLNQNFHAQFFNYNGIDVAIGEQQPRSSNSEIHHAPNNSLLIPNMQHPSRIYIQNYQHIG